MKTVSRDYAEVLDDRRKEKLIQVRVNDFLRDVIDNYFSTFNVKREYGDIHRPTQIFSGFSGLQSSRATLSLHSSVHTTVLEIFGDSCAETEASPRASKLSWSVSRPRYVKKNLIHVSRRAISPVGLISVRM